MKRRSWPVRGSLLGLALLGILGAPRSAPGQTDDSLLPDGPMVGARTFDRFGCSRCHAVGAFSDSSGEAPNLKRVRGQMSFYDGAARIWNHAPGMFGRMEELHIPFPQVRGRDVVNLIAFFTTYQYWSLRPHPLGAEGRGAILFREKGCASCHQGAGGKLAGFVKASSMLDFAAAMWRHQAVTLPPGTKRSSFALHGRDMADISAYVASGAGRRCGLVAYVEPGLPARGAKVFRGRGCVRCHTFVGQGTGKTPLHPDSLRDGTDVARALWDHAVVRRDAVAAKGTDMSPFKATDLSDLVSYLLVAGFVEQQGNPVVGEVIFGKRGCTDCHQPLATGGKPLKANTADVVARMWRKAPRMRSLAPARGIDWPKISDGEMRDVVAYVRGLLNEGRFGTKKQTGP